MATNDKIAIVNIMTSGKINDYTLNSDKAKQQLLSSSKRTHLQVTNQTKKTTKFSLCAGTYKEVIFPLLDEWSSHDLSKGGVQIKSSPRMEVQLTLVRHDTESTSKNTQTVVDLCFKGKKVKLHLYHTNQTGLVQGENHEEFYAFLSTMITNLSRQSADRVKWFNRLIMSTFKPGPPRAGASRAGVRRPPSQPASSSTATVQPAGSSVSTSRTVRTAHSQLELSGIPNCSQDISLASLGAVALDRDTLVEPTLEEAVCQAAAGMEGQSTSTPNLSPVSSPARRQATTQKTATAPYPATSLSGLVPMCSQAAQYIQKVQQVPQTPKNMTASQRIIFPLDGSPLSSECEGDSDTDISLWEDASSAGQLNEALQLLSGPPGALQDLPSPPPEAVTELLSSLLEEAVTGATSTSTGATTGSTLTSTTAAPGGPAFGSPPLIIAQPQGQMEGEQAPAGGMEAGGAFLLDPCRPTHDTTGDVLRFLTEMRKQSKRLEVMERREENMEKLLLSLQNDVRQVHSRLEVQLNKAVPSSQPTGGAVSAAPVTGGAVSAAPATGGAVYAAPATGGPVSAAPVTGGAVSAAPVTGGAVSAAAATPTAGGAVSAAPALGGAVSTASATEGARPRAPPRLPRLPRAPQPDTAQQEQATRARHTGAGSRENRPRANQTSSRDTLKCNQCDHKTTNERRMANHVRNIHTQPQPASASV
jgi:hypothetical protein